jgi:hypothetical protein
MTKKREVGPDLATLETWAKLGGGALEPERELSEGERIVAEANEVVREWLNPSTWRPQTPNPFRRDR